MWHPGAHPRESGGGPCPGGPEHSAPRNAVVARARRGEMEAEGGLQALELLVGDETALGKAF